MRAGRRRPTDRRKRICKARTSPPTCERLKSPPGSVRQHMPQSNQAYHIPISHGRSCRRRVHPSSLTAKGALMKQVAKDLALIVFLAVFALTIALFGFPLKSHAQGNQYLGGYGHSVPMVVGTAIPASIQSGSTFWPV